MLANETNSPNRSGPQARAGLGHAGRHREVGDVVAALPSGLAEAPAAQQRRHDLGGKSALVDSLKQL